MIWTKKWIIILEILKKKHFDDNSKKLTKWKKKKTIVKITNNIQSYDNNIEINNFRNNENNYENNDIHSNDYLQK